MESKTLRNFYILGILTLSVFMLFGSPAYANHSLGKPCYGCHNLRSINVIVGSRSINKLRSYLTSAPNAYVTGGPFDCSFCHEPAGDMLDRFSDGIEAATGAGSPNAESTHPVDVITDQDGAALEIVCADCHMQEFITGVQDVAPAGLQTKDDNDGYPNHNSINGSGYTLYFSAGGLYPNDANNRAHLTVPYGWKVIAQNGSAINDSNRIVNWATTNALDETNLLCFICHGVLADANTITMTGVTVPPDPDPVNDPYPNGIKGEYEDPATLYNASTGKGTAGHPLRVINASSGGMSEGDRMPCFNCHESHSAMDALTPASYNAKLIRLKNNPYLTSSFRVAGTMRDADGNGKIDDERPICAGCHNSNIASTTSTDSFGTTGRNMRGLTAVDPWDASGGAGGIHDCAGIDGADIANSTVGCLSGKVTDQLGGCHRNAHNPGLPDSDTSSCYSCHGSSCVTTIIRVNDEIDDINDVGYWGRGGDFGLEGENSRTLQNSINILSTHNITFSAGSNGGDGSIAGEVRGSCTVCHTIERRPATGRSNHGDGDPRNDFRDVDPDISVNELQLAPDPTTDYRYNPEWMVCVDCHDNTNPTTDNATNPYYGIIGSIDLANEIAPLNLDEFPDIFNPSAYEYAYGAGDFNQFGYYNNIDADAMLPPSWGTDNNATPVKRYNMQPYKAHYYQSDGVVLNQLWSTEVIDTTTDPLNGATYAGASPSALARIVNCLDCHYGHGSRHEKLYRSPVRPRWPIDTHITAGRGMCRDCHQNAVSGGIDVSFPVPLRITSDDSAPVYVPPQPGPQRDMWPPPATDRYGNPVIGFDASDNMGDVHDETDPVGSTLSCFNDTPHYDALSGSAVVNKCHDIHAPSCEACHAFYPAISGGLDVP